MRGIGTKTGIGRSGITDRLKGEAARDGKEAEDTRGTEDMAAGEVEGGLP